MLFSQTKVKTKILSKISAFFKGNPNTQYLSKVELIGITVNCSDKKSIENTGGFFGS